jgi:hypothetical protein
MNKLKLFKLGLILFLFSIINVSAQKIIYPENSTVWLVDMFFKQTQFPEKSNYFYGEMIQEAQYPTIGEELNGRGAVTFRKIELNDRSGVYAINIKDDGNNAIFYCYLTNVSGNWKIESVRKFHLPVFIYSSADSLSRIDNLPDSVSSLLASLQLMISTDENLKAFLSENINDLYKIVNSFKNNEEEELDILMNKLNLEYIFVDDLYPQCIFVLVGGFGRTEVGFIHSSNKSSLPKISPGGFIYIEEVLPNWYTYRAM